MSAELERKIPVEKYDKEEISTYLAMADHWCQEGQQLETYFGCNQTKDFEDCSKNH